MPVPIPSTDQNFSMFGNEGSLVGTSDIICRRADDVLSDNTPGNGPDSK